MLSNTHFAMAVHVLSALAYQAGRLVGSEDLAYTVGTNPSFLRGLIGELRDAGLVETQLGKGGGTRLARDAGEITLHDIFQATEKKPGLTRHSCDPQSKCEVARRMNGILNDLNLRVESAVEDELGKTTLKELVAEYLSSAPR